MSSDEQLLADLTKVEKEISNRGWTGGRLINWAKSVVGRRAKVDDCGPMCMTGAVGVAVEGDKFAEWVNETGSGNALDFPWSERANRVLEELTVNIPPDLVSHHGRGRRNQNHDHHISRIIPANDHKLSSSDDAIRWVKTAKAVVSQRIFERKQAEKELRAAEDAAKRVQPARKVIHEQAKEAAPQRKQEWV